ncbi:transglycosylase [Bacteroides pyogenes F0041]|uniref:Transglycosylase n=1 Tax=Bacteroides pyogenes F0041 TaxID=1321819 RepID=U2CJD9_9BACE|nr:transglycosylase [Bacteroides pyogenes F0041]
MKNNLLKFFKDLSAARKASIGIIAFLMAGYVFCLPQELFKVPYSTVVTDRNDELLGARIASDGQWRFPPRETTPEKMRRCLVAFEDKHFYSHWGVNPFSIGRAVYQNIKNRRVVSGGGAQSPCKPYGLPGTTRAPSEKN